MAAIRKVTPLLEETLTRLYLEGALTGVIAKQTGCSAYTVLRVIKKLNLPPRPNPRKTGIDPVKKAASLVRKRANERERRQLEKELKGDSIYQRAEAARVERLRLIRAEHKRNLARGREWAEEATPATDPLPPGRYRDRHGVTLAAYVQDF